MISILVLKGPHRDLEPKTEADRELSQIREAPSFDRPTAQKKCGDRNPSQRLSGFTLDKCVTTAVLVPGLVFTWQE